MKEKKEFKKWEKIFIILSCVVIIVSFFVYLYRFIHYYRIEHVKYNTNTLIQELTNGVVSSGDGLYILDENNYFYKGEKVSNYVWYSGNLYRIVSINNTDIRLITDSNITIVSWGVETKYNKSYVYSWLNDYDENKSVFLGSISNYKVYLREFNYCNSSINKNCINEDKYVVGLLTRSEYLNAGGKLSYLNNESNYWIIDDTNELEKAYVFKEGGIGSEEATTTSLSSYGVRPVITINGNITNYEGKGTKEEPYIIKEETLDTLNDKKIGEYVSYNDYKFRILSKYENGIKVVLDKKLEDVNVSYFDVTGYIESFASKFNNLGTCTYYIDVYGSNTEYNYKNVYNNAVERNVGIQNIGDLFLGDDDNYWLYNSYDQSNQLAYKLSSTSTIIADTKYATNGIRPVICLNKDIKITSGNGTINSPYVLGE